MAFKRPERTRLQRLGVLFAGWCCILLGVIGGFLPVVQGWIFIVAGLLILSSEYEWAHNLLLDLRRRFPRFAAAMDKAMVKASALKAKMTAPFRRHHEAA